MQRAALIFLLTTSFTSVFSQVTELIGPASDKSLPAMDTVMYEAKLKYKANACHNRDSLNIYGFQLNDIPVYSDEVMSYRMKQIESPIPMDYNSYVKAYIELYTQRRRGSVSKMLGTSEYYFPIFEEILDKYGLPHEFKYLSVVESALNPNALSWCGATGLWQFMYNTGLDYGLKITPYIDERKDPVKATEAMCSYINNSYAMFGDWLLAIASYNCGPGWVSYAVRKSGGSNNFWDIQQYLPAETRGYVPAFLAACYVFKYAPEHNLFPEDPEVNYNVARIAIDQPVSFYQISQALGVSVSELETYNPSFKKNYIATNGKSQFVVLPQDAAIRFAGDKAKVYSQPDLYYASNTQDKAKQAAATPVASVSTKSTTPVKENCPEACPENATAKVDFKKLTYCVQTGENLDFISSKFKCEKAMLMIWNNLADENIQSGSEINVYVPVSN
jgi:membrane-bound lytic murein transglycosylase D